MDILNSNKVSELIVGRPSEAYVFLVDQALVADEKIREREERESREREEIEKRERSEGEVREK